MSLTLTTEKQSVVDGIAQRLATGAIGVTVGGLAGSGKTTLATQLPVLLGYHQSEVAFCAYTGKAAANLNAKLGADVATTIHSLIYRPDEQHCSNCPAYTNCLESDPRERVCHGRGVCGCATTFGLRRDLAYADEAGLFHPPPRLIIVDEASMVDLNIYRDLNSFAVPVIWVGDHFQLPPVIGGFNSMSDPDFRLETVHRQVADSPILRLAMRVRAGEHVRHGEDYGAGVRVDTRASTAEWLNDGCWPDDLLVLCAHNRTRVYANSRIRQQLGYAGLPQIGERVVCLQNNHACGISNGMLGTVTNTHPRLDRGCITLSVDLDNGQAYRGDAFAAQFGFVNRIQAPRDVDLWDFGYCLTVHKAQGSEAERVVLKSEYTGFMDKANPEEIHRRWLYTGITRARRELLIVKRPRR